MSDKWNLVEYIIPQTGTTHYNPIYLSLRLADKGKAIKGLDNLGNYVEKVMTTFNLEEESGVDLFCCFINFNSCIETLYMYIIMTNLHKKGIKKHNYYYRGHVMGKNIFLVKPIQKDLQCQKNTICRR